MIPMASDFKDMAYNPITNKKRASKSNYSSSIGQQQTWWTFESAVRGILMGAYELDKDRARESKSSETQSSHKSQEK